MKTRIISGIAGLIVLTTILLLGGWAFDIAIFAITIVAVSEYGKALKNIKEKQIFNYMNYILAISLFLMNILKLSNDKSILIALYSTVLFGHLVFKEDVSFNDLGLTLFGGIYIPFFISYLYEFEGSFLIWIILIIAWGTDTFAYFTGMFLGKNKLCPRLSPKKTIEGAIGGVVGAVAITILFANYFNIGNLTGIGLIALIGSVSSQVGDLTASKIKRIAGIKDYGNLMPGHGGVMDRFDSVIFITPLVYYGLLVIGVM